MDKLTSSYYNFPVL